MKNTLRIGLLAGLFSAYLGTGLAQWSTAQLSVARYPVGASSGSKVLFAGGPDLSGNPSNAVDIYDNSTDSWATASLSEKKGAMAATAASGKVFFAGGFTMGGVPSDVVDIYDAGANLWATDHLSQARSHLAAASLGTKSFFGGGMASGIASSRVDIFDSNSGTWSTASLSAPRLSLAAAAAGTKVVFAGGYDIINNQQVYSDVVEIYDVVTDTWTTATLSQGRAYMAAAVINDKIFFAGGSSQFLPSGVVDIYDTSTNTWTTASLSSMRTGIAATTAGSKVFFAGGTDVNTNSSVVDIYDVLTDTWSVSHLSIARNYLAAASVGSRAFFAGGYSTSIGPSTQVDVYETDCSTAILTVSPPVTICSSASANLTVSGGNNYAWTPSATLSASTGASVTATPTTTTTYLVRDASQHACASVTVTVKPSQVVTFLSTTQTICLGGYVPLFASASSNVSWTPSTGLSWTTGLTVLASPTSTTTYTVTTNSGYGCDASATVTVNVNPCNGQSVNRISLGRWGLAGTSVGGKAIFGGGNNREGFNETQAEAYSNAVDLYDNASGTWSTGSLSRARMQLAATSSGSKALFAGGKHEGGIYNVTSSSIVDIYDNSTGSWSVASLSQARHELAAASVGGKSFFAGGFSYENQYSNVVDIYDHATGTWSTTTLSVPRSQLTAIALGTKVFFAGGIGPGEIRSNVVDIYDVTTAAWTTAHLSEARNFLTSAAVGTKVMFAGGRLSGDVSSQTATVDIYDSSTDQWTTASLSKARDNFAATTVGSKVVFAGGYAAAAVLNAIDIYDDLTNSWTTGTLSMGRMDHAAASVGTKAIFAGGLGFQHADDILAEIIDFACTNNGVIVSPSTTVCAGASTILTASDANSYSWTPSTGLNVTTGSSVTASPSVTTTYLVSGDHGNGCVTTKTVTVTVHNVPLTVSPSTSICPGNATTLSATGATTYAWSPSPGLSSLVGSTITASPTTTTTYDVEGTDAMGCKANSTVTVTVRSLPTLTVTPSQAICIGSATDLSVSGASTYLWSPSAGLSNTSGDMIAASPTTTTAYNVEGTDSFGCKNSADVTITVNPLPVLNVSPPQDICIGIPTTLSATGASTYTWSPSTGLSGATGSSVTANPHNSIIYNVEGTDAQGCKSSASINVTVRSKPVIYNNSPQSICEGTSTRLIVTGAANYAWISPAAVANSTDDDITVSPAVSTIYSLRGTDAFGCVRDTTLSVTVKAKPVVTVSPSKSICFGESVTLVASGANSYVWRRMQSPGTPMSIDNSIFVNPVESTTYTVTGMDAIGCTNDATTTLTVLPLPIGTITPPQVVCSGSSALLTVVGVNSVAWSPSTGLSSSNGTTVSASPPSTTRYIATATGDNGCSIELATTVSVFQTPKPVITSTPFSSRVTKLESSVAAGNQWFESGVKIAGANSSIFMAAPGNYSVQVTQNGCAGVMSDLFTIVITGIEQNGMSGAMTIYPNPVAEALQVQWMGFDLSQGIELRILDQSGRVMVQQTIHSENHSIDVSCLASGSYLLEASQRDRAQTQRFIKK